MFGIGNSSASHTDNLKNDFLILGKGDTFGINGSFGAPESKINIKFSKAKTKCCLKLDYNSDDSYLFVNRKKVYKFKAGSKNNFPSQFCLGSIPNKFDYSDAKVYKCF